MAITLATIANRLNMKLPRTVRLTIEAQSGRFQAIRLPMVDRTSGGETAIMQSGQDAAEFDLDEAKRVLGDVFAPWVQDLGCRLPALRSRRLATRLPTGSRARRLCDAVTRRRHCLPYSPKSFSTTRAYARLRISAQQLFFPRRKPEVRYHS